MIANACHAVLFWKEEKLISDLLGGAFSCETLKGRDEPLSMTSVYQQFGGSPLKDCVLWNEHSPGQVSSQKGCGQSLLWLMCQPCQNSSVISICQVRSTLEMSLFSHILEIQQELLSVLILLFLCRLSYSPFCILLDSMILISVKEGITTQVFFIVPLHEEFALF